MRVMTAFDWRTARSRLGDASGFPRQLRDATDAADDLDAFEGVTGAVAHAADVAYLEPFAPEAAEELLAVASSRGRQVAPLMHGLLRLLEPVALRRGDPRVWPTDSFGGFHGRWEQRHWQDHAEQLRLSELVRERVHAHAPTLIELMQSDDERVLASTVAVASLSGAAPLEAAVARLPTSQRDTQLSVVASAFWPGLSAADAMSVVGHRDALAPEARLLLDLLQRRAGSDADPMLQRCLRTAPRPCDATGGGRHPWDDVLDLVWFGGSTAGLFAAAASLADSSALDDRLTQIVGEARPEDETPGWWTPSGASAYWLLRRRLGRHWMQGIVVGPEDLADGEVEFLRRLVAKDAWTGSAGHALHEFGLTRSGVESIIRGVPDSLRPVHPGFFFGAWVQWSRWKWIRNAVAQTRRQPRDVQRTVIEHVRGDLLRAAGGQPDFEKILDEEFRTVRPP